MATPGKRILDGLKQALTYAKCEHEWVVVERCKASTSKRCSKCDALIYIRSAAVKVVA